MCMVKHYGCCKRLVIRKVALACMQLHSVREDELSCVAHKVRHWTNDSLTGLGQGSSRDEVKSGLIGPTLVRVEHGHSCITLYHAWKTVDLFPELVWWLYSFASVRSSVLHFHLQPFAVQSGRRIDSTEDEDTRDQERRKFQLERKAFRKDHEMVYYVYATSQSHHIHMYIYACMHVHAF